MPPSSFATCIRFSDVLRLQQQLTMPQISIINNNKAAPPPQPTKIQNSLLLKNGVFLLMVTVVVVGVLVDVVSLFVVVDVLVFLVDVDVDGFVVEEEHEVVDELPEEVDVEVVLFELVAPVVLPVDADVVDFSSDEVYVESGFVSEFCTHFESTVTQPTDTRKAV